MSVGAKFILDGIEVEKIKVQRLAQCVLFGLVEPTDVQLTPTLHQMMSETIVNELQTTLLEMPSMFGRRAERAFRWAVRDDVEAEFGIFMGERLRALVQISEETVPEAKAIFKTPEYRAYAKKFKPVLDAVRSRRALR